MGENEYEDDYDHEEYYDDNQHNQPQQHIRPQPPYSGSGANVDQRFKHYPRNRRDLPDFSDLELKNRLSCNRSKCALIKCTTGPLETDSSAWLALRMRLVTQTLNLVCCQTFAF